jgi:hypothetical protein
MGERKVKGGVQIILKRKKNKQAGAGRGSGK